MTLVRQGGKVIDRNVYWLPAGEDVTLWPGESRTIPVTWASAELHGSNPVISLSG